MLSMKTKYAVQACLHLARRHGQGRVLIADIAEAEAIPRKFLELILLELKNAGILASRKGKGGGYTLAHPPSEVSLGSILRVIEGPIAPLSCVSQTEYKPCAECPDPRVCGLRLVMQDVRDAVAEVVDSTTLKDIIDRSAEAAAKGGGFMMFHI
jgi:Rrf2 family protein